MNRLFYWLAGMTLSCLLTACSGGGETGIVNAAENFATPPRDSRPMVWWHWMDGNITKEGIRKDLEWMDRAGLRGFHLFDAALQTPQVVEDRYVYMTPQWKEAFRYALNMADSLDLEVGIASSPGWSHSGGPWVKREEAMKKLVWRELEIRGGTHVDMELPSPFSTVGSYQNAVPSNYSALEKQGEGLYEDICVVALRDEAGNHENMSVTASSEIAEAGVLSDGDLRTGFSLKPGGTDGKSWIEYTFEVPVTISSVVIADHGDRGEARLLADGKEILSLPASTVTHGACVPQVTRSFQPVTASRFRLVMQSRVGGPLAAFLGNKSQSGDVLLTEFRLSAMPLVNYAEAKAGFCAISDLQAYPTLAYDVRFPAQAIDLTPFVHDGKLRWDAPEGKWKIYRFGWSLTGRMNTPAPAEATGLEVDKLDADAWKRYFTAYLDMYRDAAGRNFGKIDYLLTDSYEAGCATWTPRMFREFKSRRGYELLPWMPALTGAIIKSPPATEAFLRDWRQTLSELAAERFDELSDILHSYGLQGRNSESHETGRALIADGMDLKRTAEVPMAAIWTPGPIMGAPTSSSLADMRESASVSHIYGQKHVAAESMTAVGLLGLAYSYYPGNLKPVADLEFASGVNRIIVHESAHQPLDDYFPGVGLSITGQWFNRHETWAEQARPWTDYLARTSYLLAEGRNVADFLVYYGEDTNITARYADGEIALPKGYNYDFVNPYALLNVIEYKKGRFVAPSGCSWNVLVLDADFISADVQKRLDGWKTAGAKICTLTELSSFGIAPDVETASEVRYVHRSVKDGEIYWVSKPSSEFETVTLSFRCKGLVPSVWDAETGEIYTVGYKAEGERTVVTLDMTPNDAKFVVFADPSVAAPPQNDKNNILNVSPVILSASKESVLIDGPWHVSFQKGRGAPAEAVFDHLISFTESKDEGIRYFSGTAMYSKTFSLESIPERLVLDLGEVHEMAEVIVNGHSVRILWKVPYRADITDFVHAGENTLGIRVTNLWPNRLIRDAQLPERERLTHITFPFFGPQDHLLPAGLIGPVRITW